MKKQRPRRCCKLKDWSISYGPNMEDLTLTSYGYIRVSTRDQNEDRQLLALRELSIPEKNIFTDKQSGKDFGRSQYKKLVRRMKRDNLLYIKSIDRLCATARRFWSNDGCSLRKRVRTSWCWDIPLLDVQRKSFMQD